MLRTLLMLPFLFALPALAAEPVVTVSATGTASAKPDMAIIRLGVRRQADTAREALDAANAAMTDVLAQMDAFGIAERDLQTSDLQIQPVYGKQSSLSPSGEPAVTAYRATHVLTVRVREIAKAGEVLDRAVSLGVNLDGGITFTNAEPGPIFERARRDAVRRATDKAKVLTDAAGATLGALQAIREGGRRSGPRFAAARTQSMASGVPIATGENEYSVTITVEWALVP